MSYDDVYDDEGYDGGGRILWGRIAFFAVALLVAFFLGGQLLGGGADPAELAEAQQQVQRLSEETARLQQQVSELSGGQVQGGDQPTGAATEGQAQAQPTEAGGSEAPATAGQTYEVQSGDTLIDIAEEVYGDPDLWRLIAEANGLDEGNPLVVGQQLEIPPNPDG